MNKDMVKYEKAIYCSAGLSYVVVLPNGDVYRCQTDYGKKQLPLFNAKDGWKFIEKPLVCFNDRCDSWCDIDWPTKWVFKNNKTKPEIIESQAIRAYGNLGMKFANQTMENPIKNMIHIFWDPTFMCNYTCKYCGCGIDKYKISQNYPSVFPELSLQEWLKIWKGIYDNYDFGILTTGGGEPLLSKATLPVIEMISDKFAVSIVTNLSVNVMGIIRSGIKPRPGYFGIIASLHPTAKEFRRDIFFGSVLCLKNNGFDVAINFVGHPLQLFLAEEYKEWCDKHEILFIVTPWCGYDNERFNSIYTSAELKFIDKVTFPWRKVDNLLVFKRYKYIIETSINKLEVEEGDYITLIGNVKNTGDISWKNEGLNEKESFKLGIKLMLNWTEREIIKEFRATLPQRNIAPGDTCEFKLDIDTLGLKEGIYLAKLDLLKEGSFWFEDKGAEPLKLKLNIIDSPLKSEVIEVILPETISTKETEVISKIKIKNTGKVSWDPQNKEFNIKVGCRMYYKDDSLLRAGAIREFRADLADEIKVGEILEVEMKFNFLGLMPSEYVLIFDMVNEGKFWFQQRGSLSLIKQIKI